MTGRAELGRYGIWRTASLVTPRLAAGIERLGYGTLWLGGSPNGDLVHVESLLVAHGSPAEVAAQLARHLDAGADHVCLQLVTEEGADPLPGYAALAPALGLSREG